VRPSINLPSATSAPSVPCSTARGSTTTVPAHAVLFTDHGRTFDIYDSRAHESVLAALQLSAQKWGTSSVNSVPAPRFRVRAPIAYSRLLLPILGARLHGITARYGRLPRRSLHTVEAEGSIPSTPRKNFRRLRRHLGGRRIGLGASFAGANIAGLYSLTGLNAKLASPCPCRRSLPGDYDVVRRTVPTSSRAFRRRSPHTPHPGWCCLRT
jgi:hypothetical protein